MTAAARVGAARTGAVPDQAIRLALEALPVGVLVSTPDGDWGNAELRRIWRHDGDGPLGRRAFARGLERLDDDLPNDRRDGPGRRSSPLTAALAGRPSERARYRLRRSDGTTAVVVVSAVPLRSDGAIVGAVALAADVTALHDGERLRDSFLSILGHELRTPVTSIVTGADLLRSDNLDPDARRDVAEAVVEEANRVNRLVEQLVDLGRLERREMADPEPVHLVHLAAGVIRRERRRLPGRTIELSAEGDPPPVAGFEGYIAQALTILVDNAAKFAGRSGHVTVRIEAEDGTVGVHVLDDGPGLPSGGRDAIFRLFHRGRALGKGEGGMGIGLFVARAIVEAMHGRIWADDRPGGGADVGFALPVAE
jgi:signal transduction histidine kinase